MLSTCNNTQFNFHHGVSILMTIKELIQTLIFKQFQSNHYSEYNNFNQFQCFRAFSGRKQRNF